MCPWTDSPLIRGQWCISFSTAESCRFKEVNWSRMSTWTKVHLRAGPSLGESMSESLRWWLLIGPLTECWALFFFPPKCLFTLTPFFSSVLPSTLLLQKMTWKSRQADVDTCRMKGKHKVVETAHSGRHTHSDSVYLSLFLLHQTLWEAHHSMSRTLRVSLYLC